MVGVKKNDVSIASFVYNGDGARVKGVITETQTTTTLFVGGYFEWTGSKSTMMRYYTAGGTRLALRVGDGTGSGGLSYLFGDHLGSTSITYRISDTLTTRQLYKAWGEPSYASASLPTKYTYTGQYTHMDGLATSGVTEGFGMMFFNARWYDPRSAGGTCRIHSYRRLEIHSIGIVTNIPGRTHCSIPIHRDTNLLMHQKMILVGVLMVSDAQGRSIQPEVDQMEHLNAAL